MPEKELSIPFKTNDFCITFSTINGSGSATANSILLRALFTMGIPVSGKNIFPSNIQGLPTWYSLRVSKDGFLARVEHDDIVVAMNPATFENELDFLVPDGVLIYADDIRLPISRKDIVVYPMPVKLILKDVEVIPSLRDYIANMVYVGFLAWLLNIDMDCIYQAVKYHFKDKAKPVESNYSVIRAAYQWAQGNLEKKDKYRVESMQQTGNLILTDGNTAGALGAIYGGVQFSGWYPITPASSLIESLNDYLPVLRRDPETGKNTCVVVQAEDELAAIGMVVGAGWAGLRAMTATSGPGLSLMAEYLGLAYYAEVPLVVWDIQRVGPSTGLPTRTAQGDITFANFIGHGDTQFILLFPGSVNECFEFGWKSFDIADRYQTPVIIMTDLDFGMNQWMTEKFNYPDTPMDRGKVIWENELEEMIKRNGNWGRYVDLDGDGIPYRTLPGNQHPKSGYFARGTGHDEYARYSEEPAAWESNIARLKKKFETSRLNLPSPVIHAMDGAKIGIISFGSNDPAIQETQSGLLNLGMKIDYMRLRASPISPEVKEFIRNHERVYVVETNHDGQLRQLLILDFPELSSRLYQISKLDGLPLSAKWVREQILLQENGK